MEPTGRAARQRTRAHRALLVAWLWLGTIVGLPAVHEARHDESTPHTHSVDGSIVRVTLADDRRHDSDDSDATSARHSRPRARDGAAGPILQGVSAPHLGAGLAHHAMAIRAAAPPITSALPVDRRPTYSVAARPLAPNLRERCAPTARGPPLHA